MGPLPALVYYRHQIPIVYEGELQREEDVLEWLVANKSTGDEDEVIEDVTAKTLNTLVGSLDNLVVLFCKYFFLYSNILVSIEKQCSAVLGIFEAWAKKCLRPVRSFSINKNIPS